LERVGEGVLVPTPIEVFSVLFYGGSEGSEVFMHEASPAEVGIVNDFDIAIFKLRQHPAFPNGFPRREVADYADLHEMMEVATCGYPFGDFLWNQVGSVTSSFTNGTLSAILPAPGIARQHLSGFQLGLLSAPGNSGGPIFCLATGKVFGVLQGGPVDPKGNPILGLTTAEPVYPAFDQGLLRSCCLTRRSVTRAAPNPLFHLHEPQVSAIKGGNDIVKCGAGHRHRFH
jgi:hypothetical protein